MVQLITILIGLIFIFLCFFFIFLIYNKSRIINLIIIFLFALIIFNGIVPIFLISADENRFFSDYLYIIRSYTTTNIIVFYIQNIMLLICSILGWMLVKKKPRTITQDEEELISLIKLSSNTTKRIALSFLVLSIISYYLYSKAYGGFLGLLEYTSSIRSGLFSINNPFGFLQKLGGFSVFSTLLYSGLVIDKKIKKIDLLYYVLSIIFSIYYLFSLGGRVSFISFFVVLILAVIFHKFHQKIDLKLVIRITIVATGIIFSLYYITNIFVRGSSSLAITDFFINEVSFGFASFKNVFDYQGIFMFKHVIFSILYFLPSSIWDSKLGFDTATSFNTFLFTGGYKGNGDVLGSIPLDIISFSWLEGGFFGTIIIGILFGAFLALLQKNINKIPNNGVRSFIFSYAAIQFAVLIVLYGDTVHVIQGEFSFFLGFCILTNLIKNCIKKTKS